MPSRKRLRDGLQRKQQSEGARHEKGDERNGEWGRTLQAKKCRSSEARASDSIKRPNKWVALEPRSPQWEATDRPSRTVWI